MATACAGWLRSGELLRPRAPRSPAANTWGRAVRLPRATMSPRGGGGDDASSPSASTPTVCRDSRSDLFFIAMCRQAYGRLAGWQSPKNYEEESYEGMVEVSRALMRGRTSAQQSHAVIQGFPTIPVRGQGQITIIPANS